MAKKNSPFQRKTRTREHMVADLAVNHVERQVLLRGFTVERIVHDYGMDLVVYTYNQKGEPEEGAIYLQVKGVERLNRARGRQAFPFRLDRADLQTWLAEPMPVVLCVYDASAEVGYWLYLQHYFEGLPGFNLFRAGKTVTVHLPAGQVLNVAAVNQLASHLDAVRQQLHGRVRHV